MKNFKDYMNEQSSINERKSYDIDDVYEECGDQKDNIVNDFFARDRQKNTPMEWNVISFPRLKKIWQDYGKYNIVRDVKGMEYIVDMMIRNVARLQATTELAGHEQGGDIDDYLVGNEMEPFEDEEQESDFYNYYLETEYGTPISDYGMKPLWKLINELIKVDTPEEQLVIVDRMLQVVHQRGDLAAFFVEGGAKALMDLFLN